MKSTKLILAGGFLGAGKTTLLWEAARVLMQKGLRVGLITNDQAPELVDSALLQRNNLPVAEVSGSCFCCNFNGFTDAIRQLRADVAADVIIAEPVGSCTDLSATIIQPLKQYLQTEVEVAPLTVLADPARLLSILDGAQAELHPDAAYIYRKQLEESDMILLTKSDLLEADALDALRQRTAEAFPQATVRTASAQNGAGVGEWLEEACARKDAGKRLVEVDYDTYANGEAVLGWLNGTVCLRGETTGWDALVHTYLTRMAGCFDSEGLAVGHVKVIAENGRQFAVYNLTGKQSSLTVRGSAGEGDALKLIINARVETSPGHLDRIVWETLESLIDGRYTADVLAWKFLQPGRPQPTYRFTEVV